MYKIDRIRDLIDEHFSLQWCRNNLIIPLSVEPSLPPEKPVLLIAVGNITFLGTIGEFIKNKARRSGYKCMFVEKDTSQIEHLLDQAAKERIFSSEGLESFSFSDDELLDSLKEASNSKDEYDQYSYEFDDENENEDENEPDLSIEMLGSKIQRAAAQILIKSCRTGVSDIHIEPHSTNFQVRLRSDGVLQKYISMPRSAGLKLTACLKNMAGMDIAERRASQDGKIRRVFEGSPMQFRCSTAPAKFGEKTVLRILNSSSEILDLESLISNEEIRGKFRHIINQPDGIIIVSGPTGSGKSTTLAAALREKDNGELNIVTAEDPIEYDLGGCIQQFPVIKAKGQNFGFLLRTFLRQDPDVILIGETRDPETAESSMDAAETGHLVFTTLHARSASTSLTRLLDMEVPPYKLTSSLKAILAQRLIRRVCPECSTQKIAGDYEHNYGIRRGQTIRKATVLNSEEKEKRKAEGTLCSRCSGTGYKGRIGVYELMILNRKIAEAIKARKSNAEIQDLAEQEGMITLKDYCVNLIQDQQTTISELKKICNSEE